MNFNSLIKKTKAYEIFSGDKKKGTLSHATLVVCDDSELLESYLKVFCKTLSFFDIKLLVKNLI